MWVVALSCQSAPADVRLLVEAPSEYIPYAPPHSTTTPTHGPAPHQALMQVVFSALGLNVDLATICFACSGFACVSLVDAVVAGVFKGGTMGMGMGELDHTSEKVAVRRYRRIVPRHRIQVVENLSYANLPAPAVSFAGLI